MEYSKFLRRKIKFKFPKLILSGNKQRIYLNYFWEASVVYMMQKIPDYEINEHLFHKQVIS